MSPFACLYDLLQFGLGHRNGFERRREAPGREAIDAAAADADALEDDEARGVGDDLPDFFDDLVVDDDEAALEDEDARGWNVVWVADADTDFGDPLREPAGVPAGVVWLEKSNAGGTQP